MSRKRLAFILVPIALLAIIVLALPVIVDVNRYRGQIESTVSERIGRKVSVGPMKLSLMPLGVRINDLSIAEDPALATGRPFVRVKELYVSPRFLPLLTGNVELHALEVRDPHVELVRAASGAWNFESLRKSSSQSSDTRLLPFERVTVSRGRLGFTDLSRSPGGTPAASRAVYDNIDVTLRDDSPDPPFDLTLAVTMPGEGAQRVTLEGRAAPGKGIADATFDGNLELRAVSLSGVERFLAAETLQNSDAVVSGRAAVRSNGGTVSSSGSVTLDRPRVRGVEIGYPIVTDFDVAHSLEAKRLTIQKGTVKLGPTPLSLTGSVDLGADTPVLDVHATASDASIAEAARLASAFGVAFGAGTQVQGRLNADVRARGAADRPALDGQIRLRNISISGKDIPQPVRSDAVDLALTPTEIRSNEFSASSGQTAVVVRAAVRQYTEPTPVIDASARTGDADLGELLNVARAWGVAPEGTKGSGRASLDVRASGPLDALTLGGSGRLRDATITTTALTQQVRVPAADLSFSKDAATIDSLTASIGKTTARGKMSLRNFTAPRVDFDLAADHLDIAELQRLVPESPAARTTSKPADGDSMLNRTTGGGRLRVGTIAYEQLTLDDVQATVAIDRGVIRLDPLTAGLYGGRHRGVIAMDMRRTPASFTVNSQLDKVDANRLASSVTNLRDVIFGALGTQARVSFAGDSAEAMAKSLNGTFSLNLADGRIANLNLTQEIARIASFATGKTAGDRATRVAGLTGTFNVVNGLATTNDLAASIEGGTLGATGTVNLADQSLNMRLTAVLARDYSERVGGTNVGGYLTTALANQNGELVIPLIVTGTAQQPRIAPDAQKFADMKLRNLLPSLRDPQELTSRVLGAIKGGQQEGATPKSGVGGLLDAIRGRGAATAPKPADAATPPQADGTAPPPKPKTQDPKSTVEELLNIFGKKPAPKPEEKKAP
jgi:uncharacterized protein involved in outer membrane biogenesis